MGWCHVIRQHHQIQLDPLFGQATPVHRVQPRQIGVASGQGQPRLLRLFSAGVSGGAKIALEHGGIDARAVMWPLEVAVGEVEYDRCQRPIGQAEPACLFHKDVEGEVNQRQQVHAGRVLDHP